MLEVAHILRAISWPIVALVAFYKFGGDLRRLIERIGVRVDQAANIKIKMAGLGLELAGLVVKRNGAGARPLTVDKPDETPLQEFERLLAEYEAVNSPERARRVERRNQLADRMGQLARQLKLARSALAEGPDVKIAALATVIIIEPKKSDLSHLSKAAQNVQYKFSGYRLVLALLAFIATFPLSPKSLALAVALLDDVETRTSAADDDDLSAIIEHTRRLIEASTP